MLEGLLTLCSSTGGMFPLKLNLKGLFYHSGPRAFPGLLSPWELHVFLLLGLPLPELGARCYWWPLAQPGKEPPV